MTTSLQIRVVGPLAPFAAGFARSLVRQGYTRHSATQQMRLMAHLSRWLAGERLVASELHTTAVERFLRARRDVGYAQYLTTKAMRPILTSLRDQGVSLTSPSSVARGPVDFTIERYRQYLTHERGLTESTVCGYVHAVRPFLHGRISPDGLTLDWASMDAADITAFVVGHVPHQSRGTATLTVTALRSLLRFLHLDGTLARPLAAAVPAVARWRLAGLPKGLSPAEVRALLASCDRRTAMGRRDFAVLTTLVRLGLRAGELAALRLDDINWPAGMIVIRGKGHRLEQLPVPVDVGDAVVAYLRRGRPVTATARTVFVRRRAPHDALSNNGVSAIVFAAAHRAGIGSVRAHRLRHTAATDMLRAGAPLTEIAQLLRHRRVLTTAIYAKVDRVALRTIARPWLGGVV
jgi:site-specific recombinase XerD